MCRDPVAERELIDTEAQRGADIRIHSRRFRFSGISVDHKIEGDPLFRHAVDKTRIERTVCGGQGVAAQHRIDLQIGVFPRFLNGDKGIHRKTARQGG